MVHYPLSDPTNPQELDTYLDTIDTSVAGKIGGTVGVTDNRVPRSDGTGGKTLQATGITVDDSDNMSGVATLTATTLSPTNALAINKGGTANTTATAAFDALAPTTTRGDIIARGASNNVRLALGGTGKGLRSDGTDVVYGNEWAIVFKTADESLQNNTFQDDDHLSFAVAANTKYAWRCHIHYNTPSAADFKVQWTGPASPTLVRVFIAGMAPDGTTWVGTGIMTTFSSPVAILGAGANTAGYVEFSGVLQNGANAGTVHFQWAQNTTTASDTTVYAGSHIDYAIVA